MTLEKLEGIREKIAALPKQIVHVMDGTPDEWSEYESINRADTLEILDAAIAEERVKPSDDAMEAAKAWLDRSVAHPENTTMKLADFLQSFAAERERKLIERCADAAERWFYNTIASLESVELEGFLKPLREKQIATLRAAIMHAAGSQYHAAPAKPEPGDVVAWRAEEDGRPMVQVWPKGLDAPSTYVVLMRAAEVERKIEEARP